MNTIYTVRIHHDEYMEILNKEFTDATQLKLFLKMIHASLELKNDFRYFDAEHFLISVPYHILEKCLILTNSEVYKLSTHLKTKVKEGVK